MLFVYITWLWNYRKKLAFIFTNFFPSGGFYTKACFTLGQRQLSARVETVWINWVCRGRKRIRVYAGAVFTPTNTYSINGCRSCLQSPLSWGKKWLRVKTRSEWFPYFFLTIACNSLKLPIEFFSGHFKVE